VRNATTYLVLSVFLGAYASEAAEQSIEPRVIQAVEAALPKKARVNPRQKRRLLVFTLCKGFPHESIPLGARVLDLLGRKTGAYEAVVSDDPASFKAEFLARFDGVCMLNTTGSLFDSAELKNNLLEFVQNGKGIVGIHAATDCFYDWPAYGEMMGAYFDGHPWGAADIVHVKLDDPGHPVCSAFKGRGFSVTEEIYQFKAPYSRATSRILLSLDMSRTSAKNTGVNRTDNDFAVSWVRHYGQGRVFHCSLGHNEAVFAMPAVLQHYLDGIQFALGDLPADTTPSTELAPGYLEKSQEDAVNRALPEWIAEIAAYDWGANSDGLNATENFLAGLPPSSPMRRKVVRAMARVLDSKKATTAGRQWVCKQIHRFGSDESIPYLARLLTNDDTADMALYALERMPMAAAGNVLRKALSKSQSGARAAIARSLGERRDTRAVRLIAPLAADADPGLAKAALSTLGKIADMKAAEALITAGPDVATALRPALDDALLRCADQFLVDDQPHDAEKIFALLYNHEGSSSTHARALRGLGMVRGAAAVPLLIEALECDDRTLKTAAACTLRDLSGNGVTPALTAALNGRRPQAKVLLIQALADRMDGDAIGAVTDATDEDNGEVRIAAITALARLGNSASVPTLARIAGLDRAEDSEAAFKSLTQLKGEAVDAAIVAQMDEISPNVRVFLVRALAARHALGAIPALLNMVSGSDEALRKESYKALGVLASADSLSTLIDSMAREPDKDVRDEAEAAVVRVARRVTPVEKGIAPILRAFPDTTDSVVGRCSLIRVLGEIGDDHALETVRNAIKDPRREVADVAVRALAQWRTPTPLEDLFGFAQHQRNETLRLIALRGFVRLLGQPSGRTPEETVALYEKAMALAAHNADIKKMALAGLSEVSHGRALEVIKRYQDERELADEVAVALQKVKNRAFLADTVWQFGGFTLEFRPGGALTVNGDPENSWSVSNNTLVLQAKIGVIRTEIRDDKIFLGGAEFTRVK
jgi:hypothetical protein